MMMMRREEKKKTVKKHSPMGADSEQGRANNRESLKWCMCATAVITHNFGGNFKAATSTFLLPFVRTCDAREKIYSPRLTQTASPQNEPFSIIFQLTAPSSFAWRINI